MKTQTKNILFICAVTTVFCAALLFPIRNVLVEAEYIVGSRALISSSAFPLITIAALVECLFLVVIVMRHTRTARPTAGLVWVHIAITTVAIIVIILMVILAKSGMHENLGGEGFSPLMVKKLIRLVEWVF